MIDALAEKARMVDSPDLSPATPTSELPLGAPAAYWLDIRGYDPAALAATLETPMLILQGGRDYQVTVDDDLARWRAALDGRPDVTIRIYPDFNHLFVAGQRSVQPRGVRARPARRPRGDHRYRRVAGRDRAAGVTRAAPKAPHRR